MMNDDVAERLKKILVDEAGDSLTVDKIHRYTSLYGKGLGLSSLDVISLVVRLEDEFAILFEADEVAPSVKTFGSLLEAIQRKIAIEGTARSSEEGG